MFDIANKIAYAGQMVKATKDIIENGYIGDSVWFHIKANNAPINKHVLTEELDLLKGKINALRIAGYTNEIFVISPFKSVAKACELIYRHIAGVSCGTIHRFQGKEADIVFLVLGDNPTSQGARDWVSFKRPAFRGQKEAVYHSRKIPCAGNAQSGMFDKFYQKYTEEKEVIEKGL